MKESIGIEPEHQINRTSKNYVTLFSIISIFNFIGIIFTLIFLIGTFFLPNSFHGNNIDEYTNDYCQNNTNEYYEFLCTNKYYKYNIKKSKFIWILTDGTASDQLILLSNLEKYKITSSFLAEEYEISYKHTNNLHESLITGKYNRNHKGEEINYDNIIQQMVNAGYKINYRGWSLPIPDIVGDNKDKKNENKIFNKKFIDDDHEITAFSSFCNITNPFPFMNISYDKYQNPTPNNVVSGDLLNKIRYIVGNKSSHLYDKEAKLQLYEELDELFKNNPIDLFTVNIDDCLKKSFEWNENDNISIIYYTTELDHFNHLFGKTYFLGVLQAYITEKMIERIMEWIDKHEDYVLLVSSDHGGQEFFGEDSLRNHGEDLPGNEAIFFVYSKDLKDHYDELKARERYIHIIDENEIIAQVLLNISIPINSRGFPLKLINSDINRFISLKMKEIQLIKLIEKYIEKYNKYEKSLNNILEELKGNFSLINNIIKTYITDNLEISPNKTEEFKNLMKTYEESLTSKQEEIITIIDWKNKTALNIVLFILIFIFIFIKFGLGIYFLFFKIFDHNSAELNSSRKRKCFILNIFFFAYVFILFFYGCIPGYYLRENVIDYCFIVGYLISMLLLYITIVNLRMYKNKMKIIILLFSILCYTVFIQNISYSDCFYYIKKNFTYMNNYYKAFIKLFSFYLFLYFLIIRETNKYIEKKYFIRLCKKSIYLSNLPIIYFVFLATIYVEDITRKDLTEQNVGNRILVWINFIIFIILWIISHFVAYEAYSPVEINHDDINNEIDNKIEINQNLKQSNNIASSSKDQCLDKKGINSSQDPNINNYDNKKFFESRKVEGLPTIKIFLIFCFCWISDVSEKLFGFIILIPFLEILDYLSKYFYSKMNDNNQNFDLDETKPVEISNSINNNQNTENKKKNNLYMFYFLFYLIIQDMFLIANQSSFALLKDSFGFDSDKEQQIKALHVLKFLNPLFGFVSKYRFGLIILGFFLEKGIYDKDNKNQFSMDFLVRKILLSLRIDLDILYIFYQMLINVNDRLFANLFIYSLVNFTLFLFDYLGFAFTKLGSIICK